VFLTKNERRAEALRKRQEEVARMRRGMEDQRRNMGDDFDSRSRRRSRSPPTRDYRGRDRMEEVESESSDGEPTMPAAVYDSEVVDDARLKEIDLIKRQKLGLKKEKKKVKKKKKASTVECSLLTCFICYSV